MKRNMFNYFLSLGIAVFVLASCSDEDVIKSDYDYTPNAAQLPTGVTTGDVTSFDVVDAVVNGSVGADTTLLDWGVVYYTAEMGVEKALVASAKTAEAKFSFASKLSNLVPNTNYLYKAFALNVNGIVYGDEKSFKTKPAAPLPFQLLMTDAAAVWSAVPFVQIDADGDTQKWALAYLDAAKTQIGLRSYSWLNTPLKPENFIIMPPIQLGSKAATVDYDVMAFDKDYYAEKYKVVISTAPIGTAAQARAAEVLYTEVLNGPDMESKSIPIPEKFKGKVVWIGFAHFGVTDMYAMAITNIKIAEK
ncbi:MAG: choice-of-anchor J domain-containing protein [Bacteroidales bacterium]|nr:choice-of-anchor J domain-containing protein [Bacteroidales bacterium]